MRNLTIPKYIVHEITSLVLQTPEGLETGITLFGTRVSIPGPPSTMKPGGGKQSPPEFDRVVLAVAGPGKRATHESARYSGDENHSNAIYQALQSAMPGIRWLGELHLHPQGMTWLSSGDHHTIRKILTGTDATLHPEEFIAGVMQRRNGAVDIYPYHFTRECLTGNSMELALIESDAQLVRQAREKGIEDDRSGICTEPSGSREVGQQRHCHRWLRQWWERFRRYGRTGGDRQVHSR